MFFSAVVFVGGSLYFWGWPTAVGARLAVLLCMVGGAVVLGWVLQFLWGFVAPILSKPPQPRSSLADWVCFIGMAVAAPGLADCVQLFLIVLQGYGLDDYGLGDSVGVGFLIPLLAAQTLITFLALLPFFRVPLRFRSAWLCYLALWMYWMFFSSYPLERTR
jgi:hypothetical protein